LTVREAIESRRAFRSLGKTRITSELIQDLAECASLSASCFNNQPWRYVFVYEKEKLKELHTALSKGNEWAQYASMIIAIFGTKESDCVIKDRVYYLFDIGMATAFIILRATELGLVAHPIAGFSEKKAKDILNIPEKMRLITLVIVGKHHHDLRDVLSDEQKKSERKRPERLPEGKFVFYNSFTEE
jgi:nitroreductase